MFAPLAGIAQPPSCRGSLRRARAARFVPCPRASSRPGEGRRNHLWSKRSVERALEASGFEKISWEPLAADGAPPDPEESYTEIVGVFTARLA